MKGLWICGEKVEKMKTKRLAYVIPHDSSCYKQGDLEWWKAEFENRLWGWGAHKVYSVEREEDEGIGPPSKKGESSV